MTDVAPRLAATFAEAEDALLSRWPETKLEPSLDRIRAFLELLGDTVAVQYDVIGVDPRGVGSHSPMVCTADTRPATPSCT